MKHLNVQLESNSKVANLFGFILMRKDVLLFILTLIIFFGTEYILDTSYVISAFTLFIVFPAFWGIYRFDKNAMDSDNLP